MFEPDQSLISLCTEFIRNSKDGYAIFCADDKLIYSNPVYADIFCIDRQASIGDSFEHMIRNAFAEKRGIHIESDDIDEWLSYAATVSRQGECRIFEVDLVDGNWVLFSEQFLASGELLGRVDLKYAQKHYAACNTNC